MEDPVQLMTRDYRAEERNRATRTVGVRILVEDLPKIEALKQRGYTLAEILLAGVEALSKQALYMQIVLLPHYICK